MKNKKVLYAGFFVVITVLFCACTNNNQTGGNPPTTSMSDEEITLIIEGYGYVQADIVKIDKKSKPDTGDIVYYASDKNNDAGMAFGPDVRLAKITGKEGDKVLFTVNSFEINGEIFEIEGNGQGRLMWGKDAFSETPSYELYVPNGEYLADKWLGFECTGETDETGNSICYNRFTIKEEAIIGIIKEKIGHDAEVEKELKNIVY